LFNNISQTAGDVDMLSEILKNLPHKPVKTVGSSYATHFNQIPIPNDPPPFKPLKNYPSYPSASYDLTQPSFHSVYGPPFSSPDYSGSDKHESIVVDPKAYDAYHTMNKKKRRVVIKTKTTDATLLGPVKLQADASKDAPIVVNKNGLEIQKSIEYEIKS
jgi:hypothetical protein